MRARWVGTLVVATLALGAAGCRADDPAPGADAGAPGLVVDTAAGTVRGVDVDGIRFWRGLPYAAPPVGDLRWRPPEQPEPWTGVREAAESGPICLQGQPTSLGETGAGSEDCLTLDVRRPAGADRPLPVMVWFHGGGFVAGSGSEAIYGGAELARRGVVLVTVNYRLGRLGFLAHPALQEGDRRVGNFGLLDQVASLRWVRDNVAAFGGDADRVTIFGQSAGAVSVDALMSSPEAAGLFDRAVAQSGLGRTTPLGWEQAMADGQDALAALAGPDPSAEELRSLPAQAVARLPLDLLSGEAPVVDDVLPVSVSDTFAAGDEADVPYLAGTTDLEVGGGFPSPGPAAGRVRDLLLAELRPELLAAYGDQAELDRHLVADLLFTEPARHLVALHSGPAFLYRFAIAPQPVLDSAGGAPHSSELAFVFDDVRRQGHPVANAEQLADSVADLWVDFATDGEPDGWPPADSGQMMTFTPDGAAAAPDPWAARLDLVQTAYERLLDP